MRSVAPTASGDRRSDCARTGAPASASTVLMPTVRSSVLLPDMFEPLTTSSCVGLDAGDVVAHAARRRQQRMAEPASVEDAGSLGDSDGSTISGNGSSGCSNR